MNFRSYDKNSELLHASFRFAALRTSKNTVLLGGNSSRLVKFLMAPYSEPIFTLDARDNVMLEVTRDYFELNSEVMHREIQAMHVEAQRLLATKGVAYAQLKPALVPATDRNEAAFIFDSRQTDSDWYGYEVAKVVLPLLDKRTTQSVLCGDLLSGSQELIFGLLNEFMVLAHSFEFIHGSVLYCVYLNNLSDAAPQNLHEGLTLYPAYLGYVPATFQTRAKTYLSTTLVNSFLKHRDVVIMGHEDDVSNDEDVNMRGYPFAEFGYRVRSLQSMYYDLFLSFKIERAVYPGFEIDTEMSLNAVSRHIIPLSDCTVQLEEAKHEYLKSNKMGKLEKAGIAAFSREELAALIKTKIAGSYIYNMAFLETHNVIKFNLVVEVPRQGKGYPTRLLVALEYNPTGKMLRVITLH